MEDEPNKSDRPPSVEGLPDGNDGPNAFTEFGHYTLVKELGRGAQGAVYLAEDSLLHRMVALKMLSSAGLQSEVVRARFQREAEVTSKLDHPNICSIYEIGEDHGIPFIAMQFVRGVTLADLLQQVADAPKSAASSTKHASAYATTTLAGKEGIYDALLLIEESARALHVAHEAGLVHRDIKPGNIMITPEGDPVLVDFGLARDVEEQGHTLTETGQALGTPAYMAAEQVLGIRDEIDRRTDVYGLGATLFECLTLHRPFEADSFDVLFNQIIQGDHQNARRLNPRIPADLGTVIEVALERDRARRYSTALEFAEDLRRVRSFEPIKAKAAGPVSRARKWVRRKPAKAVGLAAFVVFGLVAVALFVAREVNDRRALRQNLDDAEAGLLAGDFRAALDDVARARERDPESARARELEARIERREQETRRESRKASDLAAAADARSEADEARKAHADARQAVIELREQLRAERGAVFDSPSGAAQRGAFAQKERDLERLELEVEQLAARAVEALERSARFEAAWGGSPETDMAFASFYLDRWREAQEAGDTTREAVYRSGVERYDKASLHADELLGRGALFVTVEPPDAEVFLFRYEPYQSVRPGSLIPRLIPVPSGGVGRARDEAWVDGFFPGDLALVITDVEGGSIADEALLEPGDLVYALNDQPAGDGLFVTSNGAAPSSAAGGVPPLTRIASLNGSTIAGIFDWVTAPEPANTEGDLVRFFGEEDGVRCHRNSLRWAEPMQLVERTVTSSTMRLSCLRGGIPVKLEVPVGERSGLRCETTAYPLIDAEENRVQTETAIPMDPGSYLLLARAPGHEDQRYPVLVPRLEEVQASMILLEEGESPPGFVYVPPGSFLSAGDDLAREPAPSTGVELAGYWIGRREVTNEEWQEFLDDPDTRRRMESSQDAIYVPRESGLGPMPRSNLGGPTTPVMGITWNDARDYVAWRNGRAQADGEPWTYDLPTELEWEKAARGVDGRMFPFGNRFDFSLVVGLHTKPRHLFDAPGGFEPRDESPFGVQDACGHRQEWVKDPYETDPNAPPLYRYRGGCWRFSREQLFRSASRGYGRANHAQATTGLRIVAHLRDGN